jgi:hypothetical protein
LQFIQENKATTIQSGESSNNGDKSRKVFVKDDVYDKQLDTLPIENLVCENLLNL